MKNSSLKIILIASLVAFFANLFFGRFLIARISTLPLLNRFKILSPQTPIVINTREEIRISEGVQVSEVINGTKSKISSVEIKTEFGLKRTGAAVNLTSDGIFAASGEAFTEKGEYWVVLSDGRAAPVLELASDPASGLIFFSASLNNLPIASFADSKSAQVGEKIFFVPGSAKDKSEVWIDYLGVLEDDRQGQEVEAGKAFRGFSTSFGAGKEKLAIAVNSKGEVLGMFGNGRLLAADAVKYATGLFLSDKKKITRAAFDFYYLEPQAVTLAVSSKAHGAAVTQVLKPNGLKVGDVITEANGQKLDSDVFLEEVLEKILPGENLVLKVYRQGQFADITIRAREMK